MIDYIVKDKSVENDNIIVLSLQPKNGGEHLDFTPGQYAAIGFRTNGRRTPMRCFSIVSSPKDAELRFAMRVEGSFTTLATTLEAGDEVSVAGPFGQFVIEPDYDRHIVLFAGGIGITPFISMLRYATQIRLPIPITLFYSGRSQNDIPFLDELRMLERQNPQLKVVYCISSGRAQPMAADNLVAGRVSEELISQTLGTWRNDSTYFICGSKGYTKAVRGMLASHTAEEQIVTESFTQATKLKLGNKLSVSSLTYGMTAAALVLGTGFIMSLDLARAVPKIASAQPKTASTASSSTSGSPTSGNDGTDSSTSSSSSSTGSSGSTSNNNYTPPQQSYYYQPVTSVS